MRINTRDIIIGKIYRTVTNINSLGRLTAKNIIGLSFYGEPYYSLEFTIDPWRKHYICKDWDELFIELPEIESIPTLFELSKKHIINNIEYYDISNNIVIQDLLQE